jgi:crossover junction endodeoxyribonuclease RuvC
VRILGIDPGSRITGFGVIESLRGGLNGRCRVVIAGTVRLGDGPLPERLEKLHLALGDLLATHGPEAVAVEGIFAKLAPRSALTLGHARGIALLCAAQAKLPVYEYPPATVKRSLTHGGNASKSSVARAVGMVLGLRTALAVDASDALAVALCHLSRSRFTQGPVEGTPSAWVRALAAAPPRRTTRASVLLKAALKGR